MLVKIFLFVFLQHITCLDNSRGLTPIKGWRPYDHENCMTNEDLIKKVADTLISTGLS